MLHVATITVILLITEAEVALYKVIMELAIIVSTVDLNAVGNRVEPFHIRCVKCYNG
jgi:hypothetical protein